MVFSLLLQNCIVFFLGNLDQNFAQFSIYKKLLNRAKLSDQSNILLYLTTRLLNRASC